MTDIFETGPYDPYNGGYPVRRAADAGGCLIASFVCESEARYFCDFANAQTRKHNTTNMAEWDDPDHDDPLPMVDVDALAAERPCRHDWNIEDVLIESSVLPDIEIWKCRKCGDTKRTVATSLGTCPGCGDPWTACKQETTECVDAKFPAARRPGTPNA